MSKTLVLASTSIYRRELLERLQLPFITAAPHIDETRLPNESAYQMVARLAQQKAAAIARQYPDALIIGSDQCAVLGEQILGKPHTHEKAIEQLAASSGRTVEFLTGLCVFDTQTQTSQLDVISFQVEFRALEAFEIENYLRREQPYNCAGSFKSEGLGISLFKRMQGDDPTALIGLPLIRLCTMLREHGYLIPSAI
ncbi:nucleoside triphosphate pyrophosphatase [uncultured Thiothrix sp.]|uniref:Maf family protein n=1 Tax=uncultured Thiothrix sp. TaxID=223185 RepID=UPI0026330837|nr:nucleoside triphosphate pyrophosphatase [uncultured Thiothrix sp.]